jgi:hypothetical protein
LQRSRKKWGFDGLGDLCGFSGVRKFVDWMVVRH